MSARQKSADSFDEFFVGKQPKEEEILSPVAVTSPFKTQPVIHHPRTASDIKSSIHNENTPLKSNVNNLSASLSPKSKPSDASPTKTYESDFDDDLDKKYVNKITNSKPNYGSVPVLKEQHSPYDSPRRVVQPKIRPSYTLPNNNNNNDKNKNAYQRRKERMLPYMRPPKRRKVVMKRFQKEEKTEIEKRLLSAHNTKVHQLQSCLAELQRQLEQERMENRTLRVIQYREEKALKHFNDQESEIISVVKDYAHELENLQGEIGNERETKFKLEQEIEKRDTKLRDQRRRLRHYETLLQQPNLDECDELREKLKEADKRLKLFEDKVADKEKKIGKLEKNYRHELNHEFSKRRDLKQEIESEEKKYTDLISKLDEKTRVIDTMHIYIQRGGRRPSHSSVRLSKSLSLQSVHDISPRFREKIVEYDRKRREQEKEEQKLKPKLKPLILPNKPPAKRERQKYVPKFDPKPQPKNALFVLPHISRDEKPSTIEHVRKEQPPIRRLSTPKSSDDDMSEFDTDTPSNIIRLKPPSAPTRTIQQREQHITHISHNNRSLTPVSSPFSSLVHDGSTRRNSQKHIEPLPLGKPKVTRELDDKWKDIFDTDKDQEKSTKNDLLSKLLSDEDQEKKPKVTAPTSVKPPAMIMFEPASVTSNGHQKKPPTRITATNLFDLDESSISTPSPPEKTSTNRFDELFLNNTKKPATRTNGRDDTFTTADDQQNPFELPHAKSTSSSSTSSAIKPDSRQNPLRNDKLHKPIVTTTTKSILDWGNADEVEEISL